MQQCGTCCPCKADTGHCLTSSTHMCHAGKPNWAGHAHHPHLLRSGEHLGIILLQRSMQGWHLTRAMRMQMGPASAIVIQISCACFSAWTSFLLTSL